MTTIPFVSGEEVSMQSWRALIGWLSNDQEAIQLLLGRNPLPTDDVASLQQVVFACRASVVSRPAFTPTNPIVDVGDDPTVKAIQARPDIQAAFAEFDWYPAMVNLQEVLAFQKLINTEGLDVRLASARENKKALFELCLPTTQPLPPSGAMVDQDGKAVTISSLNPNLRLSGFQAGAAQVNPTTQMMALTFLVAMGTSYLQVAHYKGRYFIRDGYHRASGLLRENINIAPCVVINARNFEQAVGGQPQLFLPYEVLFGERPPRLADFWDDTVACTVSRLATRKVIRIRGDEFVVQG